jgi:hypothetical protein
MQPSRAITAEAASIGLYRRLRESDLLPKILRAANARRDLLLYAALWTILGLFSAAQNLAINIAHGQPANWGTTLGTELLNWYTCGIETPFYIWLVRRFPLNGRAMTARLALYFITLLLSVPVKYLLWVPLENAIFHTRWSFEATVLPNVFAVFMGQLYFIVLLYAIEYYRVARERALRAKQLEVELSRAQLETLRSQMHPHFLFNTLNSISVLMHRDAAAADELLCRLGEMLRASFAPDCARGYDRCSTGGRAKAGEFISSHRPCDPVCRPYEQDRWIGRIRPGREGTGHVDRGNSSCRTLWLSYNRDRRFAGSRDARGP